MTAVRVVSFDLDGTITDASFADSVWLEGIPRVYALKKCISLDDAKREVRSEYDKVGRGKLEWYSLDYWIKKFGLNISPSEVLNSYKHRIKIFPEVHRVLENLRSKGFRLIVISNAQREFVDLELEETHITHYFDHVFSSTSDFRLIKDAASLYSEVCRICDITPQEMAHVGDDRYFDFEVPKRLGILAFYLDRTRQCKDEFTIHNLLKLNEKLEDKRNLE
jgi:HAD superfamily hydrolase (TIGR01493 family)